MPQCISKIRHQYAGKWFNPGEGVEIEEQHVAVLCLAGHIEEYRDKELTSASSYLTRQMRRKGR